MLSCLGLFSRAMVPGLHLPRVRVTPRRSVPTPPPSQGPVNLTRPRSKAPPTAPKSIAPLAHVRGARSLRTHPTFAIEIFKGAFASSSSSIRRAVQRCAPPAWFSRRIRSLPPRCSVSFLACGSFPPSGTVAKFASAQRWAGNSASARRLLVRDCGHITSHATVERDDQGSHRSSCA